MRKLSSGTYFFRYIFLYLVLIIVIAFTAVIINAEIYLVLIFMALVLILQLIISRFFYINRHLCEVYMDMENKQFGIDDFKSKYILPFSELEKVKTHNNKRIVELVFKNKNIYFIPIATFDLFSNSKDILITLKGIINMPK